MERAITNKEVLEWFDEQSEEEDGANDNHQGLCDGRCRKSKLRKLHDKIEICGWEMSVNSEALLLSDLQRGCVGCPLS